VIHSGQHCTAPDGSALTPMRDLGVRNWGNSPDGETALVIGTYQVHSEVSRRLLAALPPLLVLTRENWRTPLTDYLAEEVGKDEPGQQAVLDRLLDLLLVGVLRAWFARPEAAAPGVRAPVQGADRRATDGLPDQLAAQPGRRPAARARGHGRVGGPSGRLCQPVRVQHGVQAGARPEPARPPQCRRLSRL
jgi:hypothetical protein